MHCLRTVTLPCLILRLFFIVNFYTLNIALGITLKLQDISTINCVCRYISLRLTFIGEETENAMKLLESNVSSYKLVLFFVYVFCLELHDCYYFAV